MVGNQSPCPRRVLALLPVAQYLMAAPLAAGLLQLAFTVATLVAVLPTYFSFHAALAWQFFKFLLPVYYGAKYTCERLVKAGIVDGIKQYQAQAQRMASPPLAPN